MCKLENFPPIVHHIYISFIRWQYAPTNSIDFIPVAQKGIPFDLGMDKSVAKTFLGLLNLQGVPLSKFNILMPCNKLFRPTKVI